VTTQTKWYKPEVQDTGWKKHMAPAERREMALAAHGGDQLSAAKSLMALSNVTTEQGDTEGRPRRCAILLPSA